MRGRVGVRVRDGVRGKARVGVGVRLGVGLACALPPLSAGPSPIMVTVLPEPVWPYAKQVPWPPRVLKRWRTMGRRPRSKICALVEAGPIGAGIGGRG